MDEATSFGELLKQLRLRSGLTQSMLGEAVGYGVAQISMLESGKRLPDPKNVEERFLKVLGLDDKSPVGRQLVELALKAQPKTLSNSPLTRSVRSVRMGNLPNPLTSIEGRSREMSDVRQLLAGGNARIVTLVGPPGVGKTRLAVAIGQSLSDHYSDGVWWIDLTTVIDPKYLIVAMAQGLRLTLPGSETSLDQLKRALQNKQCLIILDNFEQIIGAAGIVEIGRAHV